MGIPYFGLSNRQTVSLAGSGAGYEPILRIRSTARIQRTCLSCPRARLRCAVSESSGGGVGRIGTIEQESAEGAFQDSLARRARCSHKKVISTEGAFQGRSERGFCDGIESRQQRNWRSGFENALSAR